MKNKFLVTLFSCIFYSLYAQSQSSFSPCGTTEVMKNQMRKDPSYAIRLAQIEKEIEEYSYKNQGYKVNSITTVPVVFHVLYHTSAENISTARLVSQIDVLNQDFARTNTDAVNTPSAFSNIASATHLRFCLAIRKPDGSATSGIVRKSTPKTSFTTNDYVKYSSLGGDNAWDPDHYLNIWVCNLVDNNIIGYSYYPGVSSAIDGVVLKYSIVGGPAALGTYSPYDLGRSATHEVGHYFNLIHIWGDDTIHSCSGGDGVSDTPNQNYLNSGCPSFPHISCSNSPNGDMFMNYMDYTDDACKNAFSHGQSLRMDAVINGVRSSLKSSLGCSNPINCPQNLNFTSSIANGDQECFGTITASNTIASGQTVEYDAGTLIILQPNFKALSGSDFHAVIEGCGGIYKANDLDESEIVNSDFNKPISVYPNPFNQTFTLSFSNSILSKSQIQFFNAMGQLVKSIDVDWTDDNIKMTIDMSEFNSGVYFVNVVIGDQKFVEKLIKL